MSASSRFRQAGPRGQAVLISKSGLFSVQFGGLLWVRSGLWGPELDLASVEAGQRYCNGPVTQPLSNSPNEPWQLGWKCWWLQAGAGSCQPVQVRHPAPRFSWELMGTPAAAASAISHHHTSRRKAACPSPQLLLLCWSHNSLKFPPNNLKIILKEEEQSISNLTCHFKSLSFGSTVCFDLSFSLCCPLVWVSLRLFLYMINAWAPTCGH